MTQEQNGYDSKYRPVFLDDVIGHTQTVTRLKGIIESKEYPKALLFTGPTSVGKTTLARAFASSILGKSAYGHPDFIELNAADSRSIDDMRELIALSKLRPTSGIRRFILVDEAQGILSTPTSAECVEAETKILTDRGDLSAKELHSLIQSGISVCVASFNHTNNKVEWKKVTASCVKESSKSSVSVGEARLTEDHRVFSKEKGYESVKSSGGLTGVSLEKI